MHHIRYEKRDVIKNLAEIFKSYMNMIYINFFAKKKFFFNNLAQKRYN